MDGHSRPLPAAIKNLALLDTIMAAESLDDRRLILMVPLPRASFRVWIPI